MTAKAPSKKKRPRDVNQLAKSVVDIATGDAEDSESRPGLRAKDPAAVDLGRRGGLKGGRARANALSSGERSQIAAKAARARWNRTSNDS